MRTKKNNVPKSAKTRLSDLTPKKDARGGKDPQAAVTIEPQPTPPYNRRVRKHLTL
jgi:hypothetical protein